MYLHPFFPRQPQVATCEEARDCVPRYAVDPAFLPQLYHDRIDPRVTGLSLNSIQLPQLYHTSITTNHTLYSIYRNMGKYLRSPTWTELWDSCPTVFAHKSDFRPFDRSSDCWWTHSRRNLATAVVRAAKAAVGIFVSTWHYRLKYRLGIRYYDSIGVDGCL